MILAAILLGAGASFMGYCFASWLRSVTRKSSHQRMVQVSPPPSTGQNQPLPQEPKAPVQIIPPVQKTPVQKPQEPKAPVQIIPTPTQKAPGQKTPKPKPKQPVAPSPKPSQYDLRIAFFEALIDGKIALAESILTQLEKNGLPQTRIDEYKKDIEGVRQKLPDKCIALLRAGLFKQAEEFLSAITAEPARSGLERRLQMEMRVWFMRQFNRIIQMHQQGELAAAKCFAEEFAAFKSDDPRAAKLNADLADFTFQENDSVPVQIALQRGLVSINYYQVKGALKCGVNPNLIVEHLPALQWFFFRLQPRKYLLKSPESRSMVPSSPYIHGFMKIVNALVESGANPGTVIQEGQYAGSSALSFAMDLDYYPVLEYLVRHGGDPNAASQSGITVIQKVIEKEDTLLIKYLLLKGAKIPPELLQQVYSREIQEILKNTALSQ